MGEVIRRGAVAAKRWGRAFWADYLERVGVTLGYALITFLTVVMPEGNISFEKVWPVLGLPVVLAAIKGLIANAKNPGSGASLLPAPPGPVLDDRGHASPLLLINASMLALVILLIVYAVPYLQHL